MHMYAQFCIRFLKNVYDLFIFGRAESPLLIGLFSGCSEQGLLPSCLCGLLIAVASLVERQLWSGRASVAVALGLVPGQYVGSFQIRD